MVSKATKTLGKGSILAIALSLVLVLAISLTATLAYFWDARRATTYIQFSSGVVLVVDGISNGGSEFAHRKTNDNIWETRINGGTTWQQSNSRTEFDGTLIEFNPLNIGIFAGATDSSVTVRVSYGFFIVFEEAGHLTAANASRKLEARLGTSLDPAAPVADGATATGASIGAGWTKRNATGAIGTAGSEADDINGLLTDGTTQLLITGHLTRNYTLNVPNTFPGTASANAAQVFGSTSLVFFSNSLGDDINNWTGAKISAFVVIKAIKTADLLTSQGGTNATGVTWDSIPGFTFNYTLVP
ncbi:MAG: hypothetical protein FWE53_01390 [Firmicutes bacterium]|nr:hypothetical protein [Bacillota bacterium]